MCNEEKIFKARPHPKAYPHGPLEQVLTDLFVVKGTIAMNMGFLTMTFSRNMTVIRQKGSNNKNDELVLVNTVRLDDDGLDALDKLGVVKHIIRVAGFHGMDDPFYKERYPESTVWVIEDATYFDAFATRSKEVYFQPDERMTTETKIPVQKAFLHVIESKSPKDGILVLERPEGKVLITGDSLQNMETCDEYYNCLGKICMRLMGFIGPCQVGPAWVKASKVQGEEMLKLLEFKFDHVLPGHGYPVMGQAWKKYEDAIVKMSAKKD